jgi:hypothetical protein
MMTLEEMEAKLDAKDEEAARIWELMARDAMVYSSPLFAFKKTGQQESLEFAGSGTFIREKDRYFVLTARHVWQLKLKDSDGVGVVLREVDDHRYFIETNAIVPYGPKQPLIWNGLGPDIVALEIPPNRVGTIKAMRGFYEMDGGLKAMVTSDRNEAYLLMGTPSVLGSYTSQHASVRVLGMWDGKPVPFTEGDWDYVDFSAAIRPPTPTNTFGGVSGGGLWRVQIYPHPEKEEVASNVVLEGVAFFELGTYAGKGIIRCHGVNSIRKMLENL